MTRSVVAQILIASLCVYALAGAYSLQSLPVSSQTRPSWYHPALIIPGAILTLPAILLQIFLANLIPRDGGSTDKLLSNALATASPWITIFWCVALFFLLNFAVCRFERRRNKNADLAAVDLTKPEV
jgi:hypothetical protein